jgi:anti-sigma B factor antagonist
MNTLGGRMHPPELRFDRIARANGVVCLAVTGEIDMTTGDCFRQAVMQVVDEPGVRRVLVDLAPLRFIDSNGVATLLTARRAASANSVSFGVINAGRSIRSVLRMLGVYDLLVIDEL